MKIYLTTMLLTISSLSYATNPIVLPLANTVVAEKSMKETIKTITTLPPVDNVSINVFANTISGPIKKLSTNSCIQAVDFLKPKIGEKPILIMDGGYTVEIEKGERKFQLSSRQDTLFSWMQRCEKLKSSY